jgi:hypothetical protein
MKTFNILLITLLVLSSCDPCRKLSRPKYQKCFSATTDTISIQDTFTYHDTIILHEVRNEWLIRTDTVIDTERVYYSRRGDTTVVICKGDTIYRSKDIIREVKVPVDRYIYKERIKWWWAWVLGLVVLVLFYRKK